MKPYRLTRRARASLEDIAGWTIDRFGPGQAEKYQARLVERLGALAAGEPPHGRPCEQLVSGLAEGSGLQYCREGRHMIVFREMPDALVIVDFVHGLRDLERILRKLAGENSAR